jgi:two-component system, cell cycle sensor histidine kinase DivJ
MGLLGLFAPLSGPVVYSFLKSPMRFWAHQKNIKRQGFALRQLTTIADRMAARLGAVAGVAGAPAKRCIM